MSRMIPQRTVDALRAQVNTSLENFGITCSLYIPTNLDTTEVDDIYQAPVDYEFTHYTTTCYIDWNPNIFRLKALGLFVEGELPIMVYLPYEATDDSDVLVDIDILRHSYIGIEPQYIPDNQEGAEEFELVDIVLDKFHDSAIVKTWKAVPRRFEEVSG